jgi:hypothetical protein
VASADPVSVIHAGEQREVHRLYWDDGHDLQRGKGVDSQSASLKVTGSGSKNTDLVVAGAAAKSGVDEGKRKGIAILTESVRCCSLRSCSRCTYSFVREKGAEESNRRGGTESSPEDSGEASDP